MIFRIVKGINDFIKAGFVNYFGHSSSLNQAIGTGKLFVKVLEILSPALLACKYV